MLLYGCILPSCRSFTCSRNSKNSIKRDEKFHIILQGNAEFAAENVFFEGEYTIEVPDGYRWTALQKGGGVEFQKEKISSPTWYWNYFFEDDNEIILENLKSEI